MVEFSGLHAEFYMVGICGGAEGQEIVGGEGEELSRVGDAAGDDFTQQQSTHSFQFAGVGRAQRFSVMLLEVCLPHFSKAFHEFPIYALGRIRWQEIEYGGGTVCAEIFHQIDCHVLAPEGGETAAIGREGSGEVKSIWLDHIVRAQPAVE